MLAVLLSDFTCHDSWISCEHLSLTGCAQKKKRKKKFSQKARAVNSEPAHNEIICADC